MIFTIAMCLSILVHELGHAVVQRWCGAPVSLFVYGRGPVLWRYGVFELRLLPISGSVSPAGPNVVQYRWQGVLCALAGTGAQWLIVMVIFLAQAVRVHFLRDFCVWWTAIAILGLGNLIPIRNLDGRWILEALRKKQQPSPTALM